MRFVTGSLFCMLKLANFFPFLFSKQELEVVYSYWDGSGHRRVLRLKKGLTIGKFLELAKQQLVNEFKELRSTNSEDLLYVKEDLIIPQVCQN